MLNPKSNLILNFHGLGDPHPQIEADETPFWISKDFFAEIIEMSVTRQNKFPIEITFDDGNLSDLLIALPILKKYKVQGTFFILTGRLSSALYLSPSNIAELAASGMHIGLHGRNHVDLRTQTFEKLKEETIDARNQLQDITGTLISKFAIPFGAYNRKTIRHLKATGFNRIYTSDCGLAKNDQQIQNRTSIRKDMNIGQIKKIMDNDTPILKQFKRTVSSSLRRNLL